MNQIEVNESALPGNVASAARYVIGCVTAWAIGKGYVDHDTAGMIGAVALALLPLVYGQVKHWSTHRKLVALAEVVPNSVARVKPRSETG